MTIRKGCSAMEPVTLAFGKASSISEMASQKWSILIQNMYIGTKEKEVLEIKRKAGNNLEFVNMEERAFT